MKNFKSSLTMSLIAALVVLPLLTVSVSAQDPQVGALARGYRTGYSDGYPAGLNDAASNSPREFRGKSDYQHADRGFHSSYGQVGDFRNGYRQGFEAGYNAGYDRRSFDSALPADLQRRDDLDAEVVVNNQPEQSANDQGNTGVSVPASNQPLVIARDTIMRVELMSNLSTEASQRGDRFQVRVIEPNEFQGATIEGHVADVKRPGKVKGTALLQLSFDQIRMPDGRSSNMSAQVIEVMSMSSSRNVDKVDQEGGVRGESSTKSDAKKVGGAAGIGAIIGLIVGGGSGAAIGATIGAGVGTAGVLTSRGKDLELYQGQHLRIRTAGDATIQ